MPGKGALGARVFVFGAHDGRALRTRSGRGFQDEGSPELRHEFRVRSFPGHIAAARPLQMRRKSALLEEFVPEEQCGFRVRIPRKAQLLPQEGRPEHAHLMHRKRPGNPLGVRGEHGPQDFLGVLDVGDAGDVPVPGRWGRRLHQVVRVQAPALEGLVEVIPVTDNHERRHVRLPELRLAETIKDRRSPRTCDVDHGLKGELAGVARLSLGSAA
ncbi:hypothetical protein [Streptomyces sp. G45]|uniref:hypothetical protein n=1 Tax=Streptomyces sp. G45 TaxID=3406627 RepID=UPI003C186057